mmetsp:Transcript_20446/g.15068  ORF Transcript_20446/g.15068 Transcript_20446/m.15068 type:complete len:260 (-) Transcript_20446:61-840(-)
MYSSKLFHKSMVSDNAYLHKGDQYLDPVANPFRTGNKPKKGADGEDEKKEKPFMTALVARNEENGNFAKIRYVYPYAKKTTLDPGEREDIPDTIKYITTQPLDQRKKGFGTKDANKRDEFCNDIRTEQYRETLRKEKLLTAEDSDTLQMKLTKMLDDRDTMRRSMNGSVSQMSESKYAQRVHGYDIGRTRVTEFDPRSTKDTYYHFDSENGRFTGEGPKPVSYDIGDSAWAVQYRPPQHGGRSEVKNFYDKSHLGTTVR